MEIQPRLAQVSSFVKDESSWNGPNGIIMGPSAIMLQIDAIWCCEKKNIMVATLVLKKTCIPDFVIEDVPCSASSIFILCPKAKRLWLHILYQVAGQWRWLSSHWWESVRGWDVGAWQMIVSFSVILMVFFRVQKGIVWYSSCPTLAAGPIWERRERHPHLKSIATSFIACSKSQSSMVVLRLILGLFTI